MSAHLERHAGGLPQKAPSQPRSWGGNKGIDDMEHNVVREIAMYLEKNASRGRYASTQTVALGEQVGSLGGTQPAAYQGELKALADLHEQGVLTDEEYAAKKEQILGLDPKQTTLEIAEEVSVEPGGESSISSKSVLERADASGDLDEEPGSIRGTESVITTDAVAGQRPYSRRFVGSRAAPHWYVTKVTAPEKYNPKQVAWLSCEGGSGVSHVNQIPLLDRKDLITTCRPPSWIALTPGIQHSVRIGGQDYPVTFRANQSYRSSVVEALGGWSSFEVLLEEGRAAFASKKKRWQLYPGDLRPRSETAFVACNDYSEVLMIDDSVLFDAKIRQRGCGDYWGLMLEPGTHTLKLLHGDLRGDFEAGRHYGIWVDTKCLQQTPGYVDTGEIANIIGSGYSTGTAAVLVLGELFSAKATCASYKVTGISVRDPTGKEAVASLVLADDPEIEDE